MQCNVTLHDKKNVVQKDNCEKLPEEMFIKYWRSITLFLTRSKLAMKIAVAEFSVRPKSSIASAVAAWLVGGNKWLQVRQCHSTALRIVARIFNLLLL